MSELSPCRRTPVEAFTEARDHRSPIWDRVLAPRSRPVRGPPELRRPAPTRWRAGAAGRGFIYIASDASRTHLHAAGTRRHRRNALCRGANRDGIVKVLELTGVLGVRGIMQGLPVLPEEMESAGKS